MKLISYMALIAAATTGMAAAVQAQEQTVEQEFDTFQSVQTRSSVEVEIVLGDRQSVTLVASGEGDVSHIKAEVRHGRLRVRHISGGHHGWDRGSMELVRITMPSLEEIRVQGSGGISVANLTGERLEANIAGSGDIVLEGSCSDLEVGVRGSGDVIASDLQCASVNVQMRGSGDAEVYAMESIGIEMRGSGDVKVNGNPRQRDLRDHGSGRVRYSSD